MIVRGISESVLRNIAAYHGLEFDNFRPVNNRGTAYAFRLIPPTSRSHYARRAASGRRVKATCYHGFRLFIESIFNAGATSLNTVAPTHDSQGFIRLGKRRTYHSWAEFRSDLPNFAAAIVGNLYSGLYEFHELCDCDRPYEIIRGA